MSDEILTIQLTAREIDLIHQCIGTNMETVKRRHDPDDPMIGELLAELGELSDDLLEQRFNRDDGFGLDREINAETQMFNAGVEAREQAKASSRAAQRRNFNLKGPDRKLSKTQTHDVWDANDPKNW
tara:strand:- start:1509 stop:1889 length:381 start_codon:yes stop_codon:yes gene_type:complete